MERAEGLVFPCDFPIKVMGKTADDFTDLVVALAKTHAPGLTHQAARVQYSRQRQYQSVTLMIRAHSRAQLDAIYRAVTSHERVVMAL